MRTDADLQQDVNDELNWDAATDATQLVVTAKDGIVTIAGKVKHCAEKYEAERIAEIIPGVKAVIVEIQVVPIANVSDADLALAASGALDAVPHLRVNGIKLRVEDGWITLQGGVQWNYQREDAAAALRCLKGVRGLANEITIEPARPASHELKTDLESALKRQFDAEDQKIAVSVSGGVVTLSGAVTDGWQRNLARSAAWNAPGVRGVRDNLAVS